MKGIWISIVTAVLLLSACSKEDDHDLTYFEVGIETEVADWRDSAFIVATSNPHLIQKIRTQLNKPVAERQLVIGKLAAGDAGYNRNAGHFFKWHFEEDDWDLADFTVEIYDGRPYSDVDQDLDYWLGTVKRFAPWGSYIRREIK